VIVARDVGRSITLAQAGEGEPLAVVARATLTHLGLQTEPDWQIELTSEIPIASGMGSSAALSAALAHGLFAQAGVAPDPATISALVYAGELIYHGAPSGIDNTVVAYGAPVWFVKGRPPEVFAPARPFRLAIGDSGAPGLTRETVAGVRARREAEPARYEGYFDAIEAVAQAARAAIEAGKPEQLGPLFDRNHALLVELGVSTPGLDRLVETARSAGALGAKLSGGGGGGNMIALVDDQSAEPVRAALLAAGAARVIVTTVAAQPIRIP
jgi:mevalonate kinase